ncbi:Uncharacterised protein [Vibrio cholerae]|nr:Uncharacterised protein [Vibrio cholerae]
MYTVDYIKYIINCFYCNNTLICRLNKLYPFIKQHRPT